MKKPYKEESLRWLTHAKDEFEEAEEAMRIARSAIDLIESKIIE